MPYNYLSLIDTVPIGIVLLNKNLEVLGSNQVIQQNFGYDSKSLTGKNFTAIFEGVYQLDGQPFPSVKLREAQIVKMLRSKSGFIFGARPVSVPETNWMRGRIFDLEAGYALCIENITSDVLLRESHNFQKQLQDLMYYTMKTYLSLSPEESKEHITTSMKLVGEFIGIDKFFIFRYNQQATTQQIVQEWHSDHIQMDYLPTVPLPTAPFKELLQMNLRGESFYVEDINKLAENSPAKEVMRRHGAQTSLTIPLMRKSGCIGYIGVAFVNKVHKISEDERTLLNVLTEILGYALDPLTVVDEKRMLGMLNSQTNYVIRINIEGKHSFWNKKFEDDFGWMYTDKGISEGDAMSSICEYDREKVTGVVFQCMSNPGQILKVEIDKPGKDGGIRSTIWEFVCLTDSTGMPSEVQCVGMDVTEDVEVRRKLEKSEAMYRSLIESSTSSVLMVDRSANLLYLNKIAASPFGLPPEKLIGTSAFSRMPGEQGNQFRNAVEKVFSSGKGVLLEQHSKTTTNEEWYKVSLQPVFDVNGRTNAVLINVTNVTELKKSAERIAASERKYKLLFDASPVPYLIMIDGKFTGCNKAAEQLTGYAEGELIGLSPFDISPELQPNGQPTVTYAMEHIGKAIANPGHNFECVHCKKDGSEFTSMATVAAIDYDGKEALFITWQDVTELRKIQNDLETKERRYREVAAHSQTIVWETDLNGEFTYISPTVAEVYGFTVEEVTGRKKIEDLYPTETAHYLREQGLEIIRNTGKLQGRVVPVVRADGELLWITRNSSPVFNEKGEHSGYRGSDNDITARKKAEDELRKFRIISDQANHGTAISDLEGNITYVNETWAREHGHRISDLIGIKIAAFHPESEMPRVMTLVSKIQTEGGFQNEEVLHLRKDGSTYPALMSAKIVVDNNGVPQFMTSTAVDITKQKETEKEIRELNLSLEQKVLDRTHDLKLANESLSIAKTEAERANHTKSDFLSRMSHELRTPMNSILGFAQLLEMDNLDERQKRSVKQILSSGNHLLDLINEVLDIARIESGHVSLSLEPVNIMNVINECLATLQPLAALRNIEMTAISCSTDDEFVKTDKQRIKQVLLNLINNAIKYNNTDGKVTVRTECKGTEKAILRISVIDTGSGINPEYIDTIFTPFERIGAENTSIEGTGLGLAVVSQLINLMGGTVGVESTPGIGSTFWIELPECEYRLQEEIKTESVGSTSNKEQQRTGTVLYIEDNGSNIQLIEQILRAKRSNISLITSATGLNAVQLAEQHQPSLILLDLNLPDIHGAEVLRNLKNNTTTSAFPVVVISADALPRQVENIRQLGAAEYVTKPINVANFLKQIDKYIN